MFGEPRPEAVMKNVERALNASDLKYQVLDDNAIVLKAMGDDLPITMHIVADNDNRTLNIYCYLMFDIPDNARDKLIIGMNTVNNSINNGSFFMVDGESKICFKIIQSYYDDIPSYKLIQNLVMIAFKTVDVNDGKLKDLIPAELIRGDVMYSRGDNMETANDDRESLATSRFSCTERERAAFEAGIKMATIYHQFVGTPVNCDTVSGMEKAISEAIGVQPYVTYSKVTVDRSVFPKGKDRFSYISLTGDMLDCVVKVKVGHCEVTAEMRYDADIKYPLMYVSSIREI